MRIAFAVLAAVLAFYALGDRLRYGSVEPPVADSSRMEPALSRRIDERLAAVRADPYSAEAWGMLGVAYDVHDLFEEGIFCYERARTLDPGAFRWPYFLGICTRLGDQQASLAYLQAAAEIDDQHAPLHYFIGDGLLGREDLEGAQKAFERAVEVDPGLVAAWLGLAKIALAQGTAGESLSFLEQALAQGPETSEVQSLFVEAYRQLGDTESMQRHAALVDDRLDFEPVTDQLRFELLWKERVTLRWRRERTESYLEDGRVADALAEALQAVRDAPDSGEAQLGLGHVYFRTERFPEAVTAYVRATTLEPDDAQAWMSLGAAELRAGNAAGSRAASERALELDPKLHQARNNLGTLLVQAGELERGIELLELSCEGMPDDVEAHFNCAMALGVAGRLERAEEVLAIAARIDPAHAQTRLEHGLTLAQLHRLDEAAGEFQAVIAVEPGLPDAHQRLVQVLLELGRHEDALSSCRAGLQRLPGHPGLSNHLVWMLATSPVEGVRNGAESLALARRLAQSAGPGNPMALRGLAAALAETGDFDAAARSAREALAIVRNTELPPEARAQVATLAAELEDCLAHYENRQPYRARP